MERDTSLSFYLFVYVMLQNTNKKWKLCSTATDADRPGEVERRHLDAAGCTLTGLRAAESIKTTSKQKSLSVTYCDFGKFPKQNFPCFVLEKEYGKANLVIQNGKE